MSVVNPVRKTTKEPTRDEIHARLKAAGILAEPIKVPNGARQLTAEEREKRGRVRSDTPSSTEIISEDRGND